MHPGCGIQLAYKILKDSQILEPPKAEKATKGKPKVEAKPEIFVSPDAANHFLESSKITKLDDPASAKTGSVVIASDENACAHIATLSSAKDLLFICVNSSGKQRLSRQMGIGGWSATASVAFYDDMIAKLKKAASIGGRRYIEVLTPCPKVWRSETSNTVEIARQAVEIGLWPLYELDSGKLSISYKPQKLSGPEAFIGLQKLIMPDRAELEKSWRLTALGKIFEA